VKDIRVLLVDDDEAARKELTGYLRTTAKFTVEEFGNGREALAHLEKVEPDHYTAVLLDFVLTPDLSGDEVFNTIRADYPWLPVVVFTGREPDKGAQTLEKGAYRYFVRPLNHGEIATTIQGLIDPEEVRRELLRSLAAQRQRTNALEQLAQIAEMLTGGITGDLKELLDQAAEAACNLTGADCAVIYPYHPAKVQFYTRNMIGSSGLLTREGQPRNIPRTEGIAALVREMKELVVPNIDRGEIEGIVADRTKIAGKIKAANFIVREKIKAFVGISLIAGESQEVRTGSDQEVGLLYVDFREPHQFSSEELDVIRIFASQVAKIIRSARILDRERALRQISKSISYETGLEKVAETILAELSKVVEYRTASIQLIQDDTRSLVAGRGFEERVIDEKLVRPISEDPLAKRIVDDQAAIVLPSVFEEPLWDSSRTEKVKSWVGAPLVFDNQVTGLLTLDHDQEDYYTETVEEILAPFCSQAAIVLHNARRIQDLEIIKGVGDVIGDKFNTEDLLDTLAHQIAYQLDCTHCSIFLACQESDETWLVLETAHGLFKEEVKNLRFKTDFGLAGWVFRNGQSVVLPDARQDKRFAKGMAESKGPRSMLVAPIKVGGRTIGVISADRDKFGWFSESNRRLVDTMAQQVGIAILRVAALEVLQGISRQILAKPDIGKLLEQIVKDAIKLTYASSGVIYLISEDGKSITRSFYPPGFDHPAPRLTDDQGTTRKVITMGEILEFPDTRGDERVNPTVREKFRSMIAVPLKLGDKVTGVLYLNYEEPHNFTETEKSLLLTLADQAAIAIENARYILELDEKAKELDERATRLRQLQQVTAKITAEAFDLEKVLEVIVEGLSEIYEGVYGAIRLYDSSRDEFVQRVDTGVLKGKIEHSPRPTGSSRHVVKEKKPLYTEPATTLPDGQPALRPETINTGVKAFAILPLLVKSELIGLLYVYLGTDYRFSEHDQEILPLFANQVAMTIDNARLFDETERQGNDLAIVNEVVKAISTEHDQNELFRKIARQVAKKLNSDQCTLFSWSRQKNKLVPEVTVGSEMKQDFSPGEGVAGWVYQHGQSALIADNSQDKRYLYLSKADRQIRRSMVVVPIKMGDKVIGVISVDKDQPGWFDNNHQQLLETLMSQAGYAIQQAKGLKIFEEIAGLTTSQQNVETVLARIIERAVELLNVNSGVIHLIHEDGQHLEESVPYPVDFPHPRSRFEKQEGLTYKIYQNGERVIVDTAHRDSRVNRAPGKVIKSIIGVPLKYEEKVIGVLFLNDNDPHRYSEAELSLLSTLADQAVIAIENARLFEQRVKDIKALQEINDAVISKEPKDILELIVKKAIEVMPGEFSTLWLKEAETGDLLREAISKAEGVELLQELGRIKAGTPSLNMQVLETGTPRIISDLTQEENFVRVYKDGQSAVSVPLRYHEGVIGTLTVQSSHLSAFTEEHSRLLDSFAEQAAVAIQNTRLFEELKQTNEKLDQELTRTRALSDLGETLSAIELED